MGALLALAVAGCASRRPALPALGDAAAGGRGVELSDTPFFAQEAFQCGPAALASVLQSAGVDVSPAQLTGQVYLPNRQGSLQAEMVAAVRRHDRVPYRLDPELEAIVAELDSGRPVLVLQNLGLTLAPRWHYAVVIGHRPAADALVLRSGTRERLEVDAGRFLASWRRAGHWGLVVLRPGEMPSRPDPDRYLGQIVALEQLGRLESARRGYAAATQRWPGETTAWLGLGNVVYELGRPDEAEAAFREVLALEPGHAIARNNLAHVLAERGCFAAALRELEAAGRSTPADTVIGRALQNTHEEISAARRRGGARDHRQDRPRAPNPAVDAAATAACG